MLLDLCRHIRTNGLQCQGVAIAGSPFCYFHDRMHKRHVPYRFTPATQGYLIPGQHIQLGPLEDHESVQVAISQVVNALATGYLEVKRATALLYGLHLASANASRFRLDPQPFDAVRETAPAPEDSQTPGVDLARPGVVYSTDPDPGPVQRGPNSFNDHPAPGPEDDLERQIQDQLDRLDQLDQEEAGLGQHEPHPAISAAASPAPYRNFGGKSRNRTARRSRSRSSKFALPSTPLYNQPNPRQPSLSPNLSAAGTSKYDHYSHP